MITAPTPGRCAACGNSWNTGDLLISADHRLPLEERRKPTPWRHRTCPTSGHESIPESFTQGFMSKSEARVISPTIDRVRALADWHETKAHKARTYRPDSAAAAMDKAAEVHDDAARRIRRALHGDEGEDR